MLQPATPNAANEVLAGLVERVTFHNRLMRLQPSWLRSAAIRDFRDMIERLVHALRMTSGE